MESEVSLVNNALRPSITHFIIDEFWHTFVTAKLKIKINLLC